MRSSCFSIAILAAALCATGSLRAQQAEWAAPGQTQPPEVKQFQGYEDQWSNAVVKADQYTMEYLLSPVFVNISAAGDITTRNQQIALLFDKGEEPVSMEQRVVTVRTFGDTAVVSGTYSLKWRTEGNTREERGVFTHVYARTGGHWACVNAQRTPVVDLTPGKPGKHKSPRKTSDAAEPFHIPLFYKGSAPANPNTAQGTSVPPE